MVAMHTALTPKQGLLSPVESRRVSKGRRRGIDAVSRATTEVRPRGGRFPEFGKNQTQHDIMDTNYDIQSWASAYDYVEEVPDGYWVDRVEGQIPMELHGTYFRNGPGNVNFLNEPVWFSYDANGIMGSVAIKEGRAFYRSRFVKTQESMMEERAGRRLFKGPFGTIPKHGVLPWRLAASRNAANGKPILAHDALYVPYEGSVLTELDPITLETRTLGLPEEPLAFLLRPILWLTSPILKIFDSLRSVANSPSGFLDPKSVRGFGDSKYDARREVTICHNYRPKVGSSSISTTYNIYEIDEHLQLHGHQKYQIDTFSMAHAIGVSENYYIINKFPVELNAKKALDPKTGLIHCIEWDSNGSHEFHVIARPGKAEKTAAVNARIYKLKETTFVYHFVNAFEEEDRLIIDAIHYPRYPNYHFGGDSGRDYKTNSTVNEPAPKWRRSICYPNGEVETTELSTRSLELCTINPHHLGRSYRYVYALISLHPSAYLEPQAIGKIDLECGDLEIWSKGSHYFAGEPLFVQRSCGADEDDGWVLSFCYNGQSKKTEFVILDAKNIDKGPVATLYLDHAICHGFHGIWTEKYYGP